MRNRFVAGITLLSFLGGAGLPVAALGSENASESRVVTSSGQVLRKAGDHGWVKVDSSQVSQGDLLRTGPDGQAIVKIGNTHLRLAANTDLRVVSLDAQSSQVALERGRILGNAADRLTIATAKTSTSVSQGEFVLETASRGSALRVVSGDARLVALGSDPVATPLLSNVPDSADQKILGAVDNLSSVQSSGDVALLGEWQRKGAGIRNDDNKEAVGGEGDASPDQDVRPVKRPDPPVVQDTPPPVQPPVTPTTPPVTPPVQTPPVVAAKGGSFVPYLLGGGLLAGILIAVLSGDDDNDNVFIPNNPGVPSPSLP